MLQRHLADGRLTAPAIALGCWRMHQRGLDEVSELLAAAMQHGITFFDHADIYGQGQSERVFAEAVAELGLPREAMILQSKCGIRNGYYDSGSRHILDSVDGILKRLDTDYLDILLLHRPDALMEPDEIAEAFSSLAADGKVRHFGVSNFRPSQIELLQRSLDAELIINQLQFGLAHSGLIDAGLNVNMDNEGAIDRDGNALDYCRLQGIGVQAWSPLQFGFFEGNFIGHPDFPELNRCLDGMAEAFGCSPGAVAIAWILRHPAAMQAIIGSTDPGRVAELSEAGRITLNKTEWYALYRAAGNRLP